MSINNPDYTHYVVAGSKIQSGWEYKEDAADAKNDLPSKAGAKVVAKSALKSRHGIDPSNDGHWHDNESLKKHLSESATHSAVRALAEGDAFSFLTRAKAELNERAQYFLTKLDKKALLEDTALRVKSDKFNSPDNTHFVIARGKIISGHPSREAADFRHSRLPMKIQKDAKVVDVIKLKKPFFDPEDNSHWAHVSSLHESTIGDYVRQSSITQPTHYIIQHHKDGLKSIFNQEWHDGTARKGAQYLSDKSGNHFEAVAAGDLQKHGLDASKPEHWVGKRIDESVGSPDHPDFTHFVMGEGKIQAAHFNQGDAMHDASRLRGYIAGAHSTSREELESRGFNIDNPDNWSRAALPGHNDFEDRMSHMYESAEEWNHRSYMHYVVHSLHPSGASPKILSGHASYDEAQSALEDAGASRHISDFVKVGLRIKSRKDLNDHEMSYADKAKNWASVKYLNAGHRHDARLDEMHDAPDQQVAPMSRQAVEALFKDYKRLSAPSQNNDDIEAHSEDGKRRTGDHAGAPDGGNAHYGKN